MVNGLDGLRHDTIVGSHHKNNKVRHLGAPGAHGGKCFMARCIKKYNMALGSGHVVCADVLGDPAGFTFGHPRFANNVEQRGFTMIDMAHDGDHGGPFGQFIRIIAFLGLQNDLFFKGGFFNLIPEFGRHKRCCIEINGLVDRGHDAQRHELGNHFVGLDAHTLGQFRQDDGIIDLDTPFDSLGGGNLGLEAFLMPDLPASTAFSAPFSPAGVEIFTLDNFFFLERYLLFEKLAVTVCCCRDGLAAFFLFGLGR